MQAAVMLYQRCTALDAIGPFEVLAAAPGIEPIFVAEEVGPVQTDSGCSIVAAASLRDTLSPEIVVVPGGLYTSEVLAHEPILDWLRGVHSETRFTTSVCTGALLLAAAGLLDGLSCDDPLDGPRNAHAPRGERGA